MKAQRRLLQKNSLKFQILWHGRPELTGVQAGTYENIVPVPQVLIASQALRGVLEILGTGRYEMNIIQVSMIYS